LLLLRDSTADGTAAHCAEAIAPPIAFIAASSVVIVVLIRIRSRTAST